MTIIFSVIVILVILSDTTIATVYSLPHVLSWNDVARVGHWNYF